MDKDGRVTGSAPLVLVEVWSDVICPWCRAGERRFDEAVAQLGWEEEVEVVCRPFELPAEPGQARPSTFDAHRLLSWALDTAGWRSQRALNRRLLQAVVKEGVDPSAHAALADVAAAVGLDRDGAIAVLGSDRYAGEVRRWEAEAAALDIYGVPTFRFAGSLLVPGAQDADTFVSLLTRVRARLA